MSRNMQQRDIRSFFGSAPSSPATSLEVSNSSENESDVESSAPKKARTKKHSKPRKYRKEWEEDFSWLEYDEDCDGAFCSICRKYGKILATTGGVWITTPFTNWKNGVVRMKAHENSDTHIQATQASLALERTRREGSIIQQLQRAESQEKMKNRAAIKALIHCTHFLARNHIAHTTNFDTLVDLVVSCGSETLKYFLENATYTSRIAVVGFIEAIGIWVEEVMLNHLQKASYYSIMADECTDISTVEELSVYCHWVENGLPVERFLEIIHLPKGNAETIYSAIVDCLKQKNLQVKKIVGMALMERIRSQGAGMVFKLE